MQDKTAINFQLYFVGQEGPVNGGWDLEMGQVKGGVGDTQAAGVEVEPVGKAGPGKNETALAEITVGSVTEDGESPGGGLDAELVGSSGVGLKFKEG